MDRSNYNFEKLRRESEKRYCSLFEEDPRMCFTVDAQGIIVSLGSSGASQLGYVVEELLGKSILTVFHPEDHEQVAAQLKTCLEDLKKLHHLDLRKIRKDKTVILGKESARAFMGDDGKLLLMMVSEHKAEIKPFDESLKSADDEDPRARSFALSVCSAMRTTFLQEVRWSYFRRLAVKLQLRQQQLICLLKNRQRIGMRT